RHVECHGYSFVNACGFTARTEPGRGGWSADRGLGVTDSGSLARGRGPVLLSRTCCSGLGEDLALTAQALDLDLDDVAGLEVREAAGQGHALRGAGEDDVARLQLHVLAEVEDDRLDVEDHV